MKRRTILILVATFLALATGGCGAAMSVTEDSAALGHVTITPALIVNWEGEGGTTFEGGVFVGCAQEGRLVEFQCHRAATPEDKAWCQKLRSWILKMQGEEPPRPPR